MIRFALLVCLAAAVPSMAADTDLMRTLKAVEDRYNKARTLKVMFSQTYQQGSGRRLENGELLLRKPGKMRWTYANPAGKLFISDGKNVFLFSPATNRVDKIKLKEADDMRAPLAFLLGKLDFSRDFKDFEAKQDAGNTVVSALPRSDKLPYTKVNFTLSAGLEIIRLVVNGQDQSVLEFQFSGEKLNPSLDDRTFHFEPPKGAEIFDATGQK